MKLRHVFIVLSVLILSACGGGGGGGGGSSGTDLKLNTSAITFNIIQNDPVTVSQNFSITWSRADVAGVVIGTLPGTTLPSWLNVSASGNSSPVTMTVSANASSLTLGSYTTTLRLVSGTKNLNVIDIVDVPVTLNVLDNVAVSPYAVNFGMNVGDTAAGGMQTVNLTQSGSVIMPIGVNVPMTASWLQAAITSNDVQFTLTNVAASLPVGAYAADVAISHIYGSSTVRVGLIVNATGVNFVTPYVATTSQAGDVIIRGHGFAALTKPTVNFGIQAASVAKVVSDSEIRATHPALAAGKYSVGVSDATTTLTSKAVLVVKNAPAYSYSAMPVTTQSHQLVYDAEREAIYAVEPVSDVVQRFTFNGTNWALATTWSTGVSGTFDCCSLTLSADGKTLYIFRNNLIYPVNLDTNVRGAAIDLFPFTRSMGIPSTLNDGSLLVNSTFNNYLFRFEPLTGGMIPLSNSFRYANSLNFASADGSRALLPYAAYGTVTQPTEPLTYYDAGTENLVTTGLQTRDLVNVFSINTTATRSILWHLGSIAQHRVYDANFNVLGSLSIFDNSLAINDIASVISPDGNRAYTYNNTTGKLQVFDLNSPDGLGGFNEIGTGSVLADHAGTDPRMLVTPDGGLIFIIGNTNMLVVPAP